MQNNNNIDLIDTCKGGIYFENNKFIFCLIPREETLLLKDNDLLIKTLKFCEQQPQINNSNRGHNRRVPTTSIMV